MRLNPRLPLCLAAALCHYSLAEDTTCKKLTNDGSDHPGKTVSSVNGISGLGIYFRENNGGTTAQYPCQYRTGQSCQASIANMTVAIGAVLSSLVKDSAAQADGKATAVPYIRRDDVSPDEVAGRVRGFLKHMGMSSSNLGRRGARRQQDSLVMRTMEAHSPDLDLKIEQFANSSGHVILYPLTPSSPPHSRLARGLQLRADPSAKPEINSPSHDGPGFKISYKAYPMNLNSDYISEDDAEALAQGMAENWANEADNPNKTTYFGIFQERFQTILSLMIIPENNGFGLEYEDVDRPCGDLSQFACPQQYHGMCVSPAPHPQASVAGMGTTISSESTTLSQVTTTNFVTSQTTSQVTSSTTTSPDPEQTSSSPVASLQWGSQTTATDPATTATTVATVSNTPTIAPDTATCATKSLFENAFAHVSRGRST